MSLSSSVSVPTFRNDQQNSRKVVSSKDLARLKKSDPFSYFSIPKMRNAEFLNDGVDPEAPDIDVFLRNDGGGQLSNAKQNQTFTLDRKTCISSECHVNLIFEHMLNLKVSKDSDCDEKDDSEEDILMSLLMSKGNPLRRTSVCKISDNDDIESDKDILNILKLAKATTVKKRST